MGGKTAEIKGRIKEAAGDFTDNQDLKESGKADKAAGNAKEALERFIDKVRDSMMRP